jgi:MoxR-like ATPase
MTEYNFTIPTPEQQPSDQCVDDSNRQYYPYIPSDGLVKAVKLAIALKRPLLLEGEPGCGKTQLAYALVHQLSHNLKNSTSDQIEWWPFFDWNIKSNSKAQSGLYTIDAVERLRETQIAGVNRSLGITVSEIQEKVKDPKNYRKFGPLGNAIQSTDKRAVLLIDEIDKADNNFCNDLLFELEQFRFSIPETTEYFPPPPEPPIIILTSNRERPLPDAFLRRCLYFYIEFPNTNDLRLIVEQRFKHKIDELFEKAINCFEDVRAEMKPAGHRQPSTSEFIDFLKALRDKNITPDPYKSLENLADDTLLSTLLKTKEDREHYRQKKNPQQRVR